MTTSIEYEEKALSEIALIDEVGMKAVERARLYAQLAQSAATREQAEAIQQYTRIFNTKRFVPLA